MSLNLPPVGLEHFLFLAGILFSIAVAGIFQNVAVQMINRVAPTF